MKEEPEETLSSLSFAIFAFLSRGLVVQLQESFDDLSPTFINSSFILTSLVFTVVSPIAGWITLKLSFTVTRVLGMLVLTTGLILLAPYVDEIVTAFGGPTGLYEYTPETALLALAIVAIGLALTVNS